MPISLTTLGHPTVLACGSTRHNIDSGGRLKLASLTNLSGTNLDAEGAQRVSGMDATNQTLTSRYPDKAALLVSTNGEIGIAFRPVYCR